MLIVASEKVRSHKTEFGRSAASFRGSHELIQQESTQLLLHQLGEIRRTFKTCGESIWGFGFDPSRVPMLFVASIPGTGERFGVSSGPVDPQLLAAPPGADVLEVPSASLERRGGISNAEGWVKRSQQVQWLVNDAGVTAHWPSAEDGIRYTPDLAVGEALVFNFGLRGYRPDSWEFARFVVHEAFHRYQLFDARWPVPLGYDPATLALESAEFDAAAAAEGRLIELAAMSQLEEDALQFVRRYVGRRTARYERWPTIESFERGTEQVEGSARYVENQYSRCNGRSARLNMPPEALRADRDWHQFGRLYRTGARILELLDRFEVNWRSRVADGEDPFAILIGELK